MVLRHLPLSLVSSRLQEGTSQSRKVRPKSMPQGGKLPKLEDLGIKVEPVGDPVAAAAAVPAAAAPAERAASSGLLMPKQRLLIKIPRAAVTAATAHAAEVAAAAKKEDGAAAGGETRATKRGKGKSGVKRARPLAASRASQPPPPPPAPTSRQVQYRG